jgi:hypothetical protein
MIDPNDEKKRSIPKVDRNSLEYRLYYTLCDCRGSLNPNLKGIEELKKTIDALVVEYETSKFNAHRNRN